MAIELITIDRPGFGNLYHNRNGQIRRAIGRFDDLYIGDRCGTVKARSDGSVYDWWETDEIVSGSFRKIRVVLAK